MNACDLILPSFFGDALSLGPHWIYSPEKLEELYPAGIRSYDDPRSKYHPGKAAGDLTHYGEQALALLKSLAKRGDEWSVDAWRSDWMEWAGQSSGYMDGASKESLENFKQGGEQPSASNDLAGASRMAPLFAVLDGEDLVQAARAQTALTHGDPQVIDAAEFFVRAVAAVMEGEGFSEAFDRAASHPYDSLPAIDWLAAARAVSEGDQAGGAEALGLTCHVPEAFPLTLALALSFGDDPLEALSENAMLGGDSAARGMILGLLLGARHGVAAFPSEWLDELKAGEEILGLLSSMGD